MGHSDLDPAVHERRPWNAGLNVGPKRPLKPRDIWAIRFYVDEHKRLRDRALWMWWASPSGTQSSFTFRSPPQSGLYGATLYSLCSGLKPIRHAAAMS